MVNDVPRASKYFGGGRGEGCWGTLKFVDENLPANDMEEAEAVSLCFDDCCAGNVLDLRLPTVEQTQL